jgi:hypothetical protein
MEKIVLDQSSEKPFTAADLMACMNKADAELRQKQEDECGKDVKRCLAFRPHLGFILYYCNLSVNKSD